MGNFSTLKLNLDEFEKNCTGFQNIPFNFGPKMLALSFTLEHNLIKSFCLACCIFNTNHKSKIRLRPPESGLPLKVSKCLGP